MFHWKLGRETGIIPLRLLLLLILCVICSFTLSVKKEGQCVSVDLPQDLLFSVLTWILYEHRSAAPV